MSSLAQKRMGLTDMHTVYDIQMEKKLAPSQFSDGTLEGREYIKNLKTGRITFLDDPKDANECEL